MLRHKRSSPYTKRLCIVLFIGFCGLLAFGVFRAPAPASSALEPQSGSDVLQIAPGSQIRREIAGGDKHVFELAIEQGRLVRFSIDKGDLALSTVLYAPAGERLVEYVTQDLETLEISIPVDAAGNYKIELQSRETANTRRPIELRVEPLAPVTALNRKDSEARRLIATAAALRSTWRAEALEEALGKYDEAAQIWKSISDFSAAALATLKAGDLCFLSSEFTEAIRYYKKAAELAEKKVDRLVQGRAVSQMGRVYSQMGDNNLAQAHLNTALDLLTVTQEKASPVAKAAYGEALLNMGEVSYSRGNFAKASDRIGEALKFLDQDRKSQARAHRLLASIAGNLGNAVKAEPEILQALNLSRETNDRTGEGLALSLLGVFQSFTGRQNDAIESQRNALQIFQQTGDRHSEAIAFNGLGLAHEMVNNRPYALINYQNALRLFESTGALDSVAVSTFKLAAMHVEDNPEQALEYLERCLKLSRAAGKHRNEANALSEIALVYASQNRPVEAAKRHRKVQALYKAIGDERGQAIALNNYGDYLFNKLHKTRQALDAYTQALPLSVNVGDKSILTTTLYNLARAHNALGDHHLGLGFIERSISTIEDLRANVGSPDLRALYFSGVRKHYDLCRDILMQLEQVKPGEGFAERAFLVSERSRARSLLDLVNESRSDLRDKATAQLLVKEREVGNLITSLARHQWDLPFESRADSAELAEVSNRLAQLTAEYQEIQAKLRTQNFRGSLLADFELTDIQQVQNALRDGNTMLLEFGLGEQRSYLWAITFDSFHSYELPSRKVIEDLTAEVYELTIARQTDAANASDYETRVETADGQFRVKAAELSQMLLGEVAEHLGTKQLVFVTEGALQFAPFEALPVPVSSTHGANESQKVLLDNHQISALPSMSTLIAMRTAKSRSATPGRLVAVFADPVFSRKDERVDTGPPSSVVAQGGSAFSAEQTAVDGPVLRGRDATRLIYAAEEADAISAVAPRGTVMIARGFAATRETAMSSRVGEYQILHFATHGFVHGRNPELSSIVLTMVDENGAETNGLMPLHDIYNLNLSAQLTVLSACQTALGKDLKGEGLIGLTHSFMSAGSKSVVASLWKVDDRATAALMSHFYDAMLRQGLPPLAALRAAKLKMMKDSRWSAPYFWAGFVFQGDYESRIEVDNSYRSLILAIVLSALVVSLVLLLLRKRRWSPAKPK